MTISHNFVLFLGLEILQSLLRNVSTKTEAAAAQSFYQAYFMELLEHILSVVTDSSQAHWFAVQFLPTDATGDWFNGCKQLSFVL